METFCQVLHVKRAALVQVKQRTHKNRLAQLPFSTIAVNTPFPIPAPSLAVPKSLCGALGITLPRAAMGSWPLAVCTLSLRDDLSHRPTLLFVFRVRGLKNQRERKATLVIRVLGTLLPPP